MEVKATLDGPVTLGSLMRVLARFDRAGVGQEDEVTLSRNRDGSVWTIVGDAPDDDADALEHGEKGPVLFDAEAGDSPD